MERRTIRRLRAGIALTAALAAAFAISRGVGDSMATEAQDPFGYAASDVGEAGADRDLYRTGAATSGERGGQTYAEYDAQRDALSVDAFEGFGCIESCEGHEAGWAWAKENEIGDPADCGGDSWSFAEGCTAYAEQNREEVEDEL